MTLAGQVANTPENVDRLADLFRSHRTRDLIANLDTTVDQISVEGRSYPITINDGSVRGNCYLCSPLTAYVDYAIEETRNFVSHPALRLAILGLIRAAAPLVRTSGLDRQVQVNNWLFSTNPVPALTRSAAARMRDGLTDRYPRHAIMIRSLNPRADEPSMAALRAEGFRMLPARQIYLFSGETAGITKDMRRDSRLLQKTPLQPVRDSDFTPSDYPRAADLYDLLYLRKYTPLNPAYTALYLSEMHRAGLMQLAGLRDPVTGDLVAVAGMFINGNTLTQPLVGYDTARPQREGLYRMVMALAQEHARSTGLFFNMSAGAAAFKRHRGATPVIEYCAVYANHLPRHQRVAVRVMETALTRIGIPLLQRFEL